MNNRDRFWVDVERWVAHLEEYDAEKMRRDFYALIDAECAEAIARQLQVHVQVLNAVAEGMARWVIR